MKYIRTKDTVARVEREEDIELFKRVGQTVADTIEELCDEFVIFNSNDVCVGIINNYETAIYKSPYKATIYGAIWTDKGLIYVAKIKDKGELELL